MELFKRVMIKKQEGRAIEQKNRIFDHYSTNLSSVLAQWNMKVGKSDGQDIAVYLCPISFRFYEKSSVAKGELTLEHVPPKSLGGQGIILTAKEINSQHGSTNDKKILQYVQTRYFLESMGSLPVYFSSKKLAIKSLKLDLLLESGAKKITLSGPEKNFNVLKDRGVFKSWGGLEMKISGRTFTRPDKMSILKIAYLLAFHRLGYQLILGPKKYPNPSFKKIADYLAGKSEGDVPFVGFIDELAPISKGILGIITSPVEYQCLSVNVSIGANGKKQFNYCVFLPHPLDENFENLTRLKRAIDGKTAINFQLEAIDEYMALYDGALPTLWYQHMWKSIFERTSHET